MYILFKFLYPILFLPTGLPSFLTLNTNSNALTAKLPYSSRCQTIASTLKIWSFKTLVLNSVTDVTPAELEHAPPAPDHSSAFPCPPPPLPGAGPGWARC